MVDGYLKSSRTVSPTSALADAFVGQEKTIRGFLSHLQEVEAYGAIVAINGNIIALDLLDNRRTFKRLWSSLLHGYAMDAALEQESSALGTLTTQEVETWLRSVSSTATLKLSPVPGVGRYRAVRAPHIAGGVVVHQDRVVHVALFPSEGQARGRAERSTAA